VMQQVRSLQVLETVNLMAGGFPHRMRFKNFNSIYWMLAPIKILSRNEELAFDDCKRILDYLKTSLEQQVDGDSPIVKDWALGKKHVFLTEGTRQHLEKLRTEKRNASVTLIQSVFRGFSARKKWPALRRGLQNQLVGNSNLSQHQRSSKPSRPRPQPISGTPPPESAAFLLTEQSRLSEQGRLTLEQGNRATDGRLTNEQGRPVDQGRLEGNPEFHDRCDMKTIQKTCSLFGLDPERPPPVPPSRPYTVTGNRKIAYPQSRVMKNSFPDEGSGAEVLLRPGDAVIVRGASQLRGHLVVERAQNTLHVPFHYLELRGLLS